MNEKSSHQKKIQNGKSIRFDGELYALKYTAKYIINEVMSSSWKCDMVKFAKKKIYFFCNKLDARMVLQMNQKLIAHKS